MAKRGEIIRPTISADLYRSLEYFCETESEKLERGKVLKPTDGARILLERALAKETDIELNIRGPSVFREFTELTAGRGEGKIFLWGDLLESMLNDEDVREALASAMSLRGISCRLYVHEEEDLASWLRRRLLPKLSEVKASADGSCLFYLDLLAEMSSDCVVPSFLSDQANEEGIEIKKMPTSSQMLRKISAVGGRRGLILFYPVSFTSSPIGLAFTEDFSRLPDAPPKKGWTFCSKDFCDELISLIDALELHSL